MTQPVLHIDFETRSAVDLREVGLYNYARHPTTDVWCMAYEGCHGDLVPAGEPSLWAPDAQIKPLRLDPYLRDHVAAGLPVYAHNAPFELAIWNSIMVPRYGWPELKPEQTFCTMAMAYAMGLPGSLEDAALATGLRVHKDTEGRALMLRMCRPRKTTWTRGVDANGDQIAAYTWWDEPEKLARLYEYCRQDVRVERELHKRLMPLSDRERKVWLLDYKINQQGVQVDIESAKAAIKLADIVKENCNAKLAEITDGAATTVTALAPFKEWLNQQGCHQALVGLAKQDVADLLADDSLPAKARAALTLRQEAGKASNAKFGVMVAQAGDDGRLRNMYQYHGAGPGRWAGRAVQTHNLPRNMPKAAVVERILELVRKGDHNAIDAIYGAPLSVVSSCLRSFFVASPGKRLISGDFANVEGRGQAWFAGEEWKLDAFKAADEKRGPGIYELAYSRMFNVPVESVKNPSEERQVGKVCLAAGTQVLTDHGIMDILDVTTEVRLWDGREWVRHAGLLDQGVRETVQVDGVEVTPDHLIKTHQTWLPAQRLATNARELSLALATGSASLPWSGRLSCQRAGCTRSLFSVLAAWLRTAFGCTTCSKENQPGALPARESSKATQEKTSGPTPTLCRTTRTADVCSIAYPRALTAATTPTTMAIRTTGAAAFRCLPRGAKIVGHTSATLLRWKDGISRAWSWTASTWTKVMCRATCDLCHGWSMQETGARSSSCKSESTNLKRVYDLANAGPRRRFTIKTDSGFLVVHNCELAFGYQGGVGSFHVMAKTYGVKVSDEKADEFKNAWRGAHPKVVKTWYDIQRAAIKAVQNPGEVYSCGHPGREAKFKVVGSFLWCLLPSGRAICYPYPKLLEGQYGPQLTYMTVPSQEDRRKGKIIHDPQNTNNWARIGTYGGSLFNNIVQGFCRDILAETMLALDAKGYPIVLHTHDDANLEVSLEHSDATRIDMERQMRTPPAWAQGFPLYAECAIMERYGK